MIILRDTRNNFSTSIVTKSHANVARQNKMLLAKANSCRLPLKLRDSYSSQVVQPKQQLQIIFQIAHFRIRRDLK